VSGMGDISGVGGCDDAECVNAGVEGNDVLAGDEKVIDGD